MPDKLPSLRPAEIIRALERCGLTVQRQSGSHVLLWKSGLRRPVVIARHTKSLSAATLSQILSQAEVTADEFMGSL